MTNLLSKLELDKKKILLIALLSFIVFYLDVALIIKLQLRGIRNASPKITKLKKDIDNLNKDLTTLQDLKNKKTEIGKATLLKSKKLILEEEIPSLLEYISDIANKNNIKIIKILPSREPKSDEKKLLITLDLSCDYHHLGSFINDLENAPDFMAVQEIKIKRDTADYLRQNVNLVLRTYVKK